MKEFSLNHYWTTELITPIRYSVDDEKRYNCYMAVILWKPSGSSDKDEVRNYLSRNGLSFDVSDLSPREIIRVGCYDTLKKRMYKRYYMVVDITPHKLILQDYVGKRLITTYELAQQAQTGLMF